MITNYPFYEVVRGGVTNRGIIKALDKTPYELDYHGFEGLVDCYNSVFAHSSDFVDFYAKGNSIIGYNDEVISGRIKVDTNWFVWDIDNVDLHKATSDAAYLIKKITKLYLKLPLENFRVFFSGNKGYHIFYLSPELEELGDVPNKNAIVRDVCSFLASDIESFDTKIYDAARIIRTTNSINSATGLYKIPIDINMFSKSVEEIVNTVKLESQNQKQIDYSEPSKEMDGVLFDLIKQSLDKKLARAESSGKLSSNDLLEGIKNGFSQGNRNSGLTSIAGMLHRRGCDDNFVGAIVGAINNAAETPLGEQEIHTIVRSVSRYSVDPAFVEVTNKDVLTIRDSLNNYVNTRKRVDRVNTGFDHMNLQLPFFDPGDVMLIAARSGVGKTTLSMQLLNNLAQSCHGYGLFESLEMANPFIGLRASCIKLNQGETKYSAEEVSDLIVNRKELIDEISEYWERLLIVDKDSLNLQQIEDYYNIANDMCNNSLRALLIDYGGLIRGTENYEGVSLVAKSLKGLAKRLQTRVIVVVQLSRAAGDGTMPVRMDMLRDSGSWEEGADYIYGGWVSKDDSNRIHISCLKNRWLEGRNNMFDLINTGLHLRSEEYKPEEAERGW